MARAGVAPGKEQVTERDGGWKTRLVRGAGCRECGVPGLFSPRAKGSGSQKRRGWLVTRRGRREGRRSPPVCFFPFTYICIYKNTLKKIPFCVFPSQFGMWCHSPTPGPVTELAGLFCAEAAAAATAVPYPPLQKSPLPEAWPTSS